MKLLAFSKPYFLDPWNKFDIFIVTASLIELIVGEVSGGGGGGAVGIIRLLRVFRVARIFRLVRQLKGIQMLLKTLFISLPSMGNVGALLALVYFIFAVLAVKLFGTIEDGMCLTRHVNFQSFTYSILTLFQMTTGENWDCIMHDAMDEQKGGVAWASVFFVIFTVIQALIMINLFVAIILDNFGNVMQVCALFLFVSTFCISSNSVQFSLRLLTE
jgi:hypothetical protein